MEDLADPAEAIGYLDVSPGGISDGWRYTFLFQRDSECS